MSDRMSAIKGMATEAQRPLITDGLPSCQVYLAKVRA